MITTLLYMHRKSELMMVKETGVDVSGRLSDEDWRFPMFDSARNVSDYLDQKPILDIAMLNVEKNDDIGIAERMRRDNRNLFLVLVSSPSVSPVMYIKPTIMASSLLLRPITPDTVEHVFTEAVQTYLKERNDSTDEYFTIDNRDGKWFIPYDKILFFESRNKKIFVVTEFEEYSLYDTLDEMESRLGDKFIRCHRSFIVARSKISKIMLSQNCIVMNGGITVPLSRSYRAMLKELR